MFKIRYEWWKLAKSKGLSNVSGNRCKGPRNLPEGKGDHGWGKEGRTGKMQHYPLLFYSFANLVNSEFPGKYHVLCFSCSFSNTVKFVDWYINYKEGYVYIAFSIYWEVSNKLGSMHTRMHMHARAHTSTHRLSLTHTLLLAI